jgi:UDP-N-acetylglucosamine 1-carboxyvinyltransferase
MASLKIAGGRALSGRVAVEGNKNSALPLIAACMLTDQPCELSNVPRIRDVEVLLDIITALGARVDGRGTGSLRIHCESVTGDRPDPIMVGRLRGSVLLLGPLLARRGVARLAPPGGDFPTRRTINTHLEALTALGALPLDEPGHAMHAPDGLKGASFYLDEASVTGTETALLAAAAASGPSEIRHAAMEPHVVELCEFLQGMGVGIEGVGSPCLRVHPAKRLTSASHRLAGDYIEAGSWGVVAAITNGHIEVTGARSADLEVIASPLKRMGLDCSYDNDVLVVRPSKLTATRRITTGLWPGFPSDLVSLVTVLATQADGRTLVHDWLYELRLFALEQMSAMRADLFLCDPHRIIVSGPTKLKGGRLDARDLRSGMALIAAALAAEGESTVSPLETVERGYASLVDRLRALGAQVEKEEPPLNRRTGDSSAGALKVE